MNKIKKMWANYTLNEKIMYALILVSIIGISTRWAYVKTEVIDGVMGLFNSDTTPQKDEEDNKEGAVVDSDKLTFTLPNPPAMLQQDEAQKWIAMNFWNDLSIEDYIEHSNMFTQIAANWAMIIPVLSNEELKTTINALFDRVKHNKDAVVMLFTAMEDVLYDPNIPVRNFEAYISTLEWIIAYSGFEELEKERPKSQLKMALKNRVGTKAVNFDFITIDGRKSSLYKVKSKYTVVFINNPGCPACRHFKNSLMENPEFVQMIDSKQLKVVGIFPDAQEKDWRKHSADIPKSWINGFDKMGKINKNDLYDCSVIPSIYLLDHNKKVLLKDVNPLILMQYFQTI